MKVAPEALLNSRIHSLDLLRGVCALGIATYHFVSWNLGIQIESLGGFGVYTFFVLSALTMTVVHSSDFTSEVTVEAAMDFYLRRIARILPLLLVAAGGALLFAAWQHDTSLLASLPSAILTGSGLFSLGPSGLLSNAVGAWSLGIELVFYMLFPIVVMFAQKMKLRDLLVVTGILVTSQQLYLLVLSGSDLAISEAGHWSYYISPLTFSPFFALGILIAYIPIPSRWWNLPAAGLLLLVLFSYSSLVRGNLYEASIHYLILTAVCAGAVALAYRSPPVPRVLIAPAGFLGNISYALYLTHWFAEFIADRVSGGSIELKALIFIVLAPAMAYVLHRMVERPAAKWIKDNLAGR